LFVLLLIAEFKTMKLSSIEGVASYTSPRFWPKDSTSLIGSIHVQIKPLLLPPLHSSELQRRGGISGTFSSSRIDRVVERVEGLLKERIRGLEELTVQVERAG
jgi:zinc transporter 5/7